MSLIIEAIFISVSMIVVFFMAFLMMFVLALFLSPIERGLSKLLWGQATTSTQSSQKGSFRDFSKKY
jgi:hypothetical protein